MNEDSGHSCRLTQLNNLPVSHIPSTVPAGRQKTAFDPACSDWTDPIGNGQHGLFRNTRLTRFGFVTARHCLIIFQCQREFGIALENRNRNSCNKAK